MFRMLRAELRPAVVCIVVLTLLTGGAYPLLVTLVAEFAMPRAARGSMVEMGGRRVGSSLVAQAFESPKFFWPRPSAVGYNGASSGGSNLGPSNPDLTDLVLTRTATLRRAGLAPDAAIPVELVTASGSGLDPHISLDAALLQVPRVAKARGIPETALRRFVEERVEGGFLSPKRLNCLLLNIQLETAPPGK